MTDKVKRRKFIFGNKMHRDLFLLVLLASLVPTFITVVSVFFLIFNITAEFVGFPEAIIYQIIPAAKQAVLVLLTVMPLAIIAMGACAYKVTHSAVGPLDRIIREMDNTLKGTKKDHIKLRKRDRFQPLVDRINKMIDRIHHAQFR